MDENGFFAKGREDITLFISSSDDDEAFDLENQSAKQMESRTSLYAVSGEIWTMALTSLDQRMIGRAHVPQPRGLRGVVNRGDILHGDTLGFCHAKIPGASYSAWGELGKGHLFRSFQWPVTAQTCA